MKWTALKVAVLTFFESYFQKKNFGAAWRDAVTAYKFFGGDYVERDS